MNEGTNVKTSLTRYWIKKVTQMFPKVPCIISTAVFTLIDLFKIAQKSTIFLGYFCKQICCHVLLKNRPIWSRGLYYFNLGTLCLSLSPPPITFTSLSPS